MLGLGSPLLRSPAKWYPILVKIISWNFPLLRVVHWVVLSAQLSRNFTWPVLTVFFSLHREEDSRIGVFRLSSPWKHRLHQILFLRSVSSWLETAQTSLVLRGLRPQSLSESGLNTFSWIQNLNQSQHWGQHYCCNSETEQIGYALGGVCIQSHYCKESSLPLDDSLMSNRVFDIVLEYIPTNCLITRGKIMTTVEKPGRPHLNLNLMVRKHQTSPSWGGQCPASKTDRSTSVIEWAGLRRSLGEGERTPYDVGISVRGVLERTSRIWRRAWGSRALLWIGGCREAAGSYSWASSSSSLSGGQARAVVGKAAVIPTGRGGGTGCLVVLAMVMFCLCSDMIIGWFCFCHNPAQSQSGLGAVGVLWGCWRSTGHRDLFVSARPAQDNTVAQLIVASQHLVIRGSFSPSQKHPPNCLLLFKNLVKKDKELLRHVSRWKQTKQTW